MSVVLRATELESGTHSLDSEQAPSLSRCIDDSKIESLAQVSSKHYWLHKPSHEGTKQLFSTALLLHFEYSLGTNGKVSIKMAFEQGGSYLHEIQILYF